LEDLDYFKSVFNSIKDKPNIKLVFSSFHEGAGLFKFLEKIVYLKKEYNLKNYQIIVINNNEIVNKFKDEIKCIYKPFLLEDLSKNYNIVESGIVYHNGNKISLCSTDDYLSTPKEKFFLTYNKNTSRIHRTKLLLWLIKTGLINDTLYSLLIKVSKSEQSILNFASNQNFKELVGLWSYYDDFEKLGYNILDWDYPNNNNDVFSNTTYTTNSHYSKTLFNIITETTIENSSFSLNLTEKSFKAFANCQPFIIIGDCGVHKKMKEFGFELYEDLIDYSFDTIYDNHERLNSALIEIKRIYNLGQTHILNWYKDNVDKIKKNQKTFLQYGKGDFITETINELKMKKVIITGCSGLVGTHLVKKCIEKGYDVIGVDIISPNAELNSYNFKFYEMDLTIEKNLKDLFEFEKPDAVFNCFGIKGSPLRAKQKPVDFLYPSFKINTEIIKQCAENDIYLCFVSSVGVYSPAEKFTEDDMWKSLPSESDWFPSWSKRMGELLLEAYKVQTGYHKWSIIRPANIFGEYDDFSGNGTVISSTVKKIYEAENEIEAWGDGSSIRDFVYAGDVADAILKLYENKISTVINFGSGVEISIKSMIESLIKISGKDISIKWDVTKPNGDLRRQMDITKQIEYDLLPKLGFEKGLEITYNHYVKNR
jgi:GDP-L-fucose synthase